MNQLNDILTEMNLSKNEVLIFEALEDQFHPIAWLESVGQFLNQESQEKYSVSSEGMKSVRSAVV